MIPMPIRDFYGFLALLTIVVTAGIMIRASLLRDSVRPERAVNTWKPKRHMSEGRKKATVMIGG